MSFTPPQWFRASLSHKERSQPQRAGTSSDGGCSPENPPKLRLRKCCVKRKTLLDILTLVISNQILAQSLNSNKLGGGASVRCIKLADRDWCN